MLRFSSVESVVVIVAFVTVESAVLQIPFHLGTYLDTDWLARCSIVGCCHLDVLPIFKRVVVADPNANVHGRIVDAGIMIIDKHGGDNIVLLLPIFGSFLNKKVLGYTLAFKSISKLFY